MGFSTSAGIGRKSQIGMIAWGSKDPTLPMPNIRFYDAETKQTSYQVNPGSTGQARVDGMLRRLSVTPVESYNDREKNTGLKSEWRMFLTLDGGEAEDLAVLGMTFLDEGLATVDQRSLQLINSLHSLMELMQKGQENGGIDRETPIQIGLYSAPGNNGQVYPRSIIRLPSGYDENGVAQFNDPKNFVRSESLPPAGVPVEVNGKPVMANGMPVRDYTAALEWANEKVTALVDFFGKKDGEQETEGESAADLAGAAAAADEVAQQRPRMTA